MSIEKASLARPYAKAVYKIAENTQNLEAFGKMLAVLAWIAKDKRIEGFLKDRSVSRLEMETFFLDITKGLLNEIVQNLVRLLAERRKLVILPEIQEIYEFLKSEKENTIQVEFFASVPLDVQQKAYFSKKISALLEKNAKLNFGVDPALIGGFIARAGCKVIDGSLKGELGRLKTTMDG